MVQKQPQSCQTPYKTTCGGQALIEGIMMQGPEKRAVVVRRPDGGLEVQTTPVKRGQGLRTLPFFRGIWVFLGSMVNGVKALVYSAQISDDGSVEEEPSALERWLEAHVPQEKAASALITLSAALGIAFSVFLFILLPTAITGLIGKVWTTMPLWVRAVVEGVVKVGVFLLYLYLCSRMKEMRRVFRYHGAEHKAIYCYERGLALTVEHVRAQPCHHPRCGTSFLFVVIMVSIFLSIVIFTPLKVENTLLRMGLHLLLLPVIVGVTYEFNRYVGRHDGAVCRLLRAPGMWMQNFTTFEPDDGMIEVAIRALEEVIPQEQGADRW